MKRILNRTFLALKRNYSTQKSPVNTGGSLFVHALKRNNVTDVFMYSGGSVMPLIDSFYNNTINYYINSHEQNCGHAATGYAKTSDKTGVCLVTSGPGITNMITPLLDAKNDSTPLVVFSGQVPLSAEGTNAFQEAPAVELTKHVTKWSYKVTDIHELYNVVDEAFKVANHGKKGSVHIDIPKCVSYQLYKPEVSIDVESIPLPKCPPLDIELFKKTIKLINSAERPILYVGQGCKDASELLRKFAIKGNIPVTTTIHGAGIFNERHPLSLRWCGMHGYAPANYSLQNADLIIALGSRFDDRTTGNLSKYAPEAKKAAEEGRGGIIHVNINPDELDFVVKSDYNFNTSCEIFLKYANAFVEYNPRSKWISYLEVLKDKYPFEYKIDFYGLSIEDVLSSIHNYTRNIDCIFTTGVGNHQMQTYQFIKSQYPSKIISSGSLGVMGAGLPYAIGAQIANKNKLVVDIDGDSSFNMTLSDMKTIVENKLPVKIAIMNNDAQMMVTVWEKLFFNERYTATLNERNPDFVALAKAYGIPAIRCTERKHLHKTVENFIYSEGPMLCEFKINKDICLPLVGPGNALDDMILPDTQTDSNNTLKGLAPS
jgi:acetolactate synthase-1/2/3 large subunit